MPKAVASIILASSVFLSCADKPPAPPPSAPPQAAAARPIAAVVNGRAISEAEVAVRLRERGTGPSRPTRDELLEQLITMELQAQAAEKQGLDKDPSFVAEMETFEAVSRNARRQKLARAYRLGTLAQAQPIPVEKAQAFFDEHRARIRTEVELERMVTRTRADADRALAALKEGAAFEEVAGEAAASETMGFDTLPDDWWQPVSALAPGGHTDILPLDGGRFAIVKLVARRELPEPTFEAVRHRIESLLTARSMGDRRSALDQELRKAATIEKRAPAAPAGEPRGED